MMIGYDVDETGLVLARMELFSVRYDVMFWF